MGKTAVDMAMDKVLEAAIALAFESYEYARLDSATPLEIASAGYRAHRDAKKGLERAIGTYVVVRTGHEGKYGVKK